MPYFKNENINLLFIHIPKTGGSSIEQFLKNKHSIQLNRKAIFGKYEDFGYPVLRNKWIQHLPYRLMFRFSKLFNIVNNNLSMLSVVRNPYNRIVSALFFNFRQLKADTSKEQIYNLLKNILSKPNIDFHFRPQYYFVTDENDNLIEDIRILRTESLNKDMFDYGYTDFDLWVNKSKVHKESGIKKGYMSYLNSDTINLINTYYKKDFILFNYDIINETESLLYNNIIKDKIKVAVFISIPKCATKTILDMHNMGINRNNDADDKNNNFIIYENHQRLKVLEEKYDLTNKFVYTFVRNPYDRVKSWFNYHKEKNIPLYKNLTLNEWISNGCKTHWVKQNSTNWKKLNISPLLQYNFIEGNTKIDYIGKIEDFENDNKIIIEKLNNIFIDNDISKRIEYKKINKNSSSNNNEITAENKELIYNMFRKDFDYFGYSKDSSNDSSKELLNDLSKDSSKEPLKDSLTSVHFSTFGSPGYEKALDRINRQAKESNFFTTIDIYNQTNTPGIELHMNFIQRNKRGYGYWIWKPLVILDMMDKYEKDSVIIYADAGCEIIKNQHTNKLFNKYIEDVKTHESHRLGFVVNYKENHWTKKDLFNYIKSDITHRNSRQVCAGIQILMNTEENKKLMQEWLEIMTIDNYHYVNDNPSILINDPEFIAHRHDQSVLSLLKKKYGFCPEKCPIRDDKFVIPIQPSRKRDC